MRHLRNRAIVAMLAALGPWASVAHSIAARSSSITLHDRISLTHKRGSSSPKPRVRSGVAAAKRLARKRRNVAKRRGAR